MEKSKNRKVYTSTGTYSEKKTPLNFGVKANHLGNVLVTVSDRKIPHETSTGIIEFYSADIVSSCDMYPFGMEMPNRTFNPDKYKFGFGSHEKDDEWSGIIGADYDFGGYGYDALLCRRKTPDPLASKYPQLSPYSYCAGNPIIFRDADGNYIVGIDGQPVTYTTGKDGQINWSSNASADVQRLGNAMLKYPTGNEVFNKMQQTDYAISVKISPDIKTDRVGYTNKNLLWNKTTNKVAKVKSMDITLYEGNYKEMKEKIAKGVNYNSTQQGALYQESIEKTNSLDNALAADLVHEGIHATDKNNIQQSAENKMLGTKNDIEALPEEKETNFLLESTPMTKMPTKKVTEVSTQDKKDIIH